MIMVSISGFYEVADATNKSVLFDLFPTSGWDRCFVLFTSA